MKIILLFCSLLLLELAALTLCDHQIHQPDYQFDLSPAGGAIEGYVTSKAKEGSKVPITQVEGQVFQEKGEVVQYLQVVVKSGARNGTEEFVVENTDAFRIDNNGYIIVNNTETFDHPQAFEFYVVMFRRELVVSDPVPFIVRAQKHVEETTYEYNQTAAIFAGVLICLIVAFALLIPFVVRAKRRHKHGKPIFKPGSHPSALTKAMAAEKGSQTNLAIHMVDNSEPHLKNRAMTEGDFYDNYGYRLEKEMERGQHELSNDLLAIASHVNELDDVDNVIQLRKKHSSDDSDSGVSSDVKQERSKGILKNGGQAKTVHTIEMEEKNTKDKKPKEIEESARL